MKSGETFSISFYQCFNVCRKPFMIRPAALAVLRPACHLEMDRKRDTAKIALDKGEFDDNISYFSWKPYVVAPHLNRLVETVQMRGHNISFLFRINKNYP